MARQKKEVLRNEDGHKLTKNGSVDQRSVKAIENLKKSSVYQNIMKAKEGVAEAKKQEVKVPDEESEDDESDDEPEFEVQSITEKKRKVDDEINNKVAEVEEKMNAKLKFAEEKNEIEDRTKKWLEEHKEASKKEKEEMKRQADEEMKLIKEENKRLKSLGSYNDHLSRISHLARNVSIKF
jgi:hypothetical protein